MDFNVPFDDSHQITDDTRIRSALPTINRAVDEGAKVILCWHLGRPKAKPDPNYSLAPVARRLQRLLAGKERLFAPDCIGPAVQALVDKMKPGDVLLLENLRFHAGEEQNDEEFAKALASLADVYINDAFGTAHRSHASTVGLAEFVPVSGAGYLMKKEIEYLEGAVANPMRPFVAILGGGKVSGKIGVIENLGKKVDKVIIGGGMAFTFIKALGLEIGNSLVEDQMLDFAKGVQEHAFSRGVKFYLPVDCVVAASPYQARKRKLYPFRKFPKAGTAWTSDRRRSSCSAKRSKMPKPFCGTAQWEFSKTTPTRAARCRWPTPSLERVCLDDRRRWRYGTGGASGR